MTTGTILQTYWDRPSSYQAPHIGPWKSQQETGSVTIGSSRLFEIFVGIGPSDICDPTDCILLDAYEQRVTDDEPFDRVMQALASRDGAKLGFVLDFFEISLVSITVSIARTGTVQVTREGICTINSDTAERAQKIQSMLMNGIREAWDR